MSVVRLFENYTTDMSFILNSSHDTMMTFVIKITCSMKEQMS